MDCDEGGQTFSRQETMESQSTFNSNLSSIQSHLSTACKTNGFSKTNNFEFKTCKIKPKSSKIFFEDDTTGKKKEFTVYKEKDLPFLKSKVLKTQFSKLSVIFF
jgi:hypothetical protein